MSVFKLPDLGEGLPDAEIREWHVKVGDVVALDAPLVSMETAKAIVDVPAPQSGTILKLFGAPGDVIETGNPLVEFSSNENVAKPSVTTKDQGTVVGNLEVGTTVEKETAFIRNNPATSSNIKAIPAVRALAKKLNIDLEKVTPTGVNNTITLDDVTNYKNQPADNKLHGTKRAMFSIMTKAHQEIVPATIMDDADITEWNEGNDISARLVRAVVKACEKVPELNATFDMQTQSLNLAQSVNLGLAVDSKEGLFVPVIKNAHDLNLKQIREKIDTIKTEVQNRTINPSDLQGNTITLSNIGSIAVKYASPIIVPPTVAIIATGRKHQAAIVIDDAIKIRTIIPLSLTFDHRCITGAEATRFLIAMIEDLQKDS